MNVSLVVVIVSAILVKCERLNFKSTSYGHVPEDYKISENVGNIERWRPLDVEDKSILNRSESIKLKTSDDRNASGKSLKYRDAYYYEPPVQQYLPPFGDDGSSGFTTFPSPIDSTDLPSHDEGYNYAIPDRPFDDLQPPFAQDEIPTLNPQYLPARGANPTINGVLLNKNKSPLHLEVNEMNCYDSPTSGKFQAVLTFKSKNENVPVFEDILQPGGACSIQSDTAPPRFNSRLYLNITKKDFQNCGVRDCSASGGALHLCVRLRFPTVSRVRLSEDAVLTLQCRTRDKIATHTKHLQINVENSARGRSSGIVAKGGGRGILRSRAVLFRRGSRGDYVEALPVNARVPLGDTLMLRTDIEPGDGWISSRLSSIVMRGAGSNSEEVVLLQADGCRSLQAAVLCPRDPIAVPPLGHTLLIRAALFEGMRSGEEMRLSVRLVGCLEAEDCRPAVCNVESSSASALRTGRKRRHGSMPMRDHIANSTAVLSFKVVIPETETDDAHLTKNKSNSLVLSMVLVLSATIACSVALLFLKTKGRICTEGRTI